MGEEPRAVFLGARQRLHGLPRRECVPDARKHAQPRQERGDDPRGSRGRQVPQLDVEPRERRIVHMALREVKGVRTESTGEEPQRRVQIIPERQPA